MKAHATALLALAMATAVPQANGSMASMPLEDMSPLLPLEQLQAEMLTPLSPASLVVRGRESH